jgi:hypothetical protein
MEKNNEEKRFLLYNGEKNGENGQNRRFFSIIEWRKGMEKKHE